ncbi:hypothetical protein PoB_004933800 [Plakobranchus ocellatus]|uniref:C-type lectin domain-containing protein n=1 Tax=Plakobranchus ocellatus TaxID=259542 RepID=A0AAV4BUH6_9GAST|nr:hypothetical protein PoB_004933800 [Plakobranchus ocellatus]
MNNRGKQLGGYLLQFEDSAEHKRIVNLLPEVPRNGPFFTDEVEREKAFFRTYNDKKPAVDHKFRWFQPDNWWNEDCVDIWISGLNDLRCGKRGRYICEVPV